MQSVDVLGDHVGAERTGLERPRILGDGLIMFGQHDDRSWMGGEPPNALTSTVSIYTVVTDPDAHHDRAKAAGALIVRDLVDQPYGSREYSARDLEGNLWSFGTYDPYSCVASLRLSCATWRWPADGCGRQAISPALR